MSWINLCTLIFIYLRSREGDEREEEEFPSIDLTPQMPAMIACRYKSEALYSNSGLQETEVGIEPTYFNRFIVSHIDFNQWVKCPIHLSFDQL